MAKKQDTTTDATQEGVLESTQDTSTPAVVSDPPMNARELAMEAVAARRDAEFEAETGSKINAEPEPAPQKPVEAALTPAPVVETPPAPDLDKQLQLQVAEPKLLDALEGYSVKVKVDGVEQTVRLDKAIANFQKDSAATKRLEDASRLMREVEAAYAAVQNNAAAGSAVAAQDDPTGKVAEPTPDLVQSVKQALDALYAGDEDQAVQSLATLLAGRTQEAPVAIQPEALFQQMMPAVRAELSKDAALEKFRTDYPTIMNDPDLAFLADRYVVSFQRDGKSLPEAITAAGEAVSAKFGIKKVNGRHEEQSPTRTAIDTKLERKAGIDNVSGLNVSTATAEPEPPTPSQVIAEMRRQRGQVM